MINIIAGMSLIIFAYGVLTIIIALYKTAIEYNKGNYVYGDKKHSNEHIALLFGLLMVAILFISWTFFHIDMSHAWGVHMVSENLSFLFIFKGVLYYYLSNHLSKELNNIT